jgi:PPOX class probable F420-dependent enzyme
VPTIPDTHRDLLDNPNVVSFATVGAGGQPQVTAIWAVLEGPAGSEVVRTSLFTGRQKYRNLLAHPRATLLAIDPKNPYRTLEVRGTVELTDDPDLAFLQRLLGHYGTDLDHFKAPTDGRVVVTLTPTRVVGNG